MIYKINDIHDQTVPPQMNISQEKKENFQVIFVILNPYGNVMGMHHVVSDVRKNSRRCIEIVTIVDAVDMFFVGNVQIIV
jgi:hypothetical protein